MYIRNQSAPFSFKPKQVLLDLFYFTVDLLGGGIRFVHSEPSEEELVQQMKRGDNRAFEILYERYFESIYRFVVRRVGSHETAEDLVSSVFMKVFVAKDRFVWKDSFKCWVYRIANNTVIDFYRTRKTTVAFEEEKHDVAAPAQNPANEIDRAKLRLLLDGVLSKLDPRSQTILQLKFFSDLDNQEIAEALHLSANHVGVLLHRGLKQCQTQLPVTLV